MTVAVVIGNGESRRDVDLKSYNSHTLVGCNAIHRDITVDHLICCDRRMAEEATVNPQCKNTQIYVRPQWYHYYKKIKKNKNIHVLPNVPTQGTLKRDHADHWGSGGYAVLLAAQHDHSVIQLIGFDLYPVNATVNNIYKGTANYAKPGSQAVDPSYWIYQIGVVFRNFQHTQFIIHNTATWPIPAQWQENNVKFVAL